MPAGQGLGQAIPRRRLGAELRRLRDERGKLLQEVAEDLLISTSKLSRLEKGQAAPRERDMRDLLVYYGQDGTELGERMRRWAREGREAPWWHDDATATVSPMLDQYLQYETAAEEISGFLMDFVPTLLQTPAYARALHSALYPDDDTGDVEAFVRLVTRRQEVLTRSEYRARLDVVLDEAVLHRSVGSPETMREQLLTLAACVGSPNVTIRVLRFSAGPHPAQAEGDFTIFHFRRAIDADVVNLEGRIHDAYIEDAAGVANYHRLMRDLRNRAQEPEESAALLRQLADRHPSLPPPGKVEIP